LLELMRTATDTSAIVNTISKAKRISSIRGPAVRTL